MKVIAHIQIHKGYGIAVQASQWPQELMERSEEFNREVYANTDEDHSDYLEHDRDRTVVTVEVEVPDSVFKREPRAVLQGTFVGVPNTNSEGTPNKEEVPFQ